MSGLGECGDIASRLYVGHGGLGCCQIYCRGRLPVHYYVCLKYYVARAWSCVERLQWLDCHRIRVHPNMPDTFQTKDLGGVLLLPHLNPHGCTMNSGVEQCTLLDWHTFG